ncbi:MAG: hypothetical protein ACOC1F_12115 [Myxococcota bacterium]
MSILRESEVNMPDPRGKERKTVLVAIALMSAVAAGMVALSPLVELPPGLAVTLFSFGIAFVFVVLAILVPLGRLTLSSWWQRFVVDDGGLHVRRGLRNDYEPFSNLRSVFIEPGTYGRLVVVRCDGRGVLNVPLVTSRQSREAELAVALFDRVRGLHRRDPALVSLARGNRSIEAWVEHLDAIRTGGYRILPIDARGLGEAAVDAALPVDIRAAAGYLLAHSLDCDVELVRATLTPRSPAWLWAMVWLAAPATVEALQPGLQRAWNLLPEEDRRGVKRLRTLTPRLEGANRSGCRPAA